jgi:hypothetical protein
MMRRYRAKNIGGKIVKHRKGEVERFLPAASGDDWTQRLDSGFYKALYESDPQIRQELYWLWEELEVVTDSLLTTFADAQEDFKKKLESRPVATSLPLGKNSCFSRYSPRGSPTGKAVY